jgi:hypothetical protein
MNSVRWSSQPEPNAATALVGDEANEKFTRVSVRDFTRQADSPSYRAASATKNHNKEPAMTTPELAAVAAIAVAIMFGLLVRARRRARAATAASRVDLLQRTVDPERGGLPLVLQDNGHGDPL